MRWHSYLLNSLASGRLIDWLIDTSFPRNVHTYTSIAHTDKQKNFHLYPNIYVPLGSHQRNYIEFIGAGSLQMCWLFEIWVSPVKLSSGKCHRSDRTSFVVKQHWFGWWLNTLRPRQDGRHFPDNIFKRIFLNENVSINFSLKCVPRCPINNIPALFR